ncbi:MAG TPA: transglutaminase-like domain-containing protein [Pirellulales bacterium]|nr:transglutaminase-like domain-containing protein [Pirellulales bacterium]
MLRFRHFSRRSLLRSGMAAGLAGLDWRAAGKATRGHLTHRPSAYSVIPVVGDGRWIWREPPENETGYLEPRPYKLSVGIRLEGSGPASDLTSTTTVPIEYPEQKIDDVQLKTSGCEARLRTLSEGAGQLLLLAPGIERGQVVSAVAEYHLTLFKQYQAYDRERFPVKQKVPAEVRKSYLQDSPGIQTRSKPVRELAAELSAKRPPLKHPWDLAKVFAEWVPANIKPQIGEYTSVTAALDDRRGDCEEMAGIFVALCRASNIPARLVWVPNHTWAEFYLVDHDGEGQWIPAHTACYSWFGFNGAHELVLQKGDRILMPERRKLLRLLPDWIQFSGAAPRVSFTAELVPLQPESGGDPGPGARRKDEKGEWRVFGDHALDRYVRR